MLMALRNVSEESLMVRDIRPLDVTRSVKVVEVALAPRGPERQSVTQGRYTVFPPAEAPSEGQKVQCVVQRIVDPTGYRLDPSRHPEDRALLVVRLRAQKPGVASVDGFEVTYEQEDREFTQIIPLKMTFPVAAGAKPLKLPPEERPCLDQVEILGQR